MSFGCKDLDAALRDDELASLAAAREHARACPGCAGRLTAWDELSMAAPLLRRSWESPGLWPRIHQALAVESQRPAADPRRLAWRWTALAAGLGLVALVATRPFLTPPAVPPPAAERADAQRRLLTERALAEVERSEADYVASIDRLAVLARPMLEQPPTPLLASYREKLQLLDDAIAECRTRIDNNRFNARLRQELLSVYHEKQRTLLQMMEERS